MLGSDYQGQNCSIARALELVGERWTMLIVRDVFLGLRRFEDIQDDLGIARNVLAARLGRLVGEGILAKHPYRERPRRHEYRLTAKGLDLWPLLVELMAWGDHHAGGPAGPPVVVRHRGCGGRVGAGQVCSDCGAPVARRGAVAEPGPGAGPAHPLRRREALVVHTTI